MNQSHHIKKIVWKSYKSENFQKNSKRVISNSKVKFYEKL